MKKNPQNGERNNFFERLKAFFFRKKNSEKPLVEENEKGIKNENLPQDFSSSQSANENFENVQKNSISLKENKLEKEIDSSLSNENEENKTTSDNCLTPQQEYVAERNINVTASETIIRSFIAKLSAIDEELKTYYADLKNYVLSFSGTRYRTSWQYDSIYKTKLLLARFVIKGKSLWMYVAISPEEVPEGTNCVTTNDKKYEGLHVGLKIQGARTFKQGKNLLNLACQKAGLTFSERVSENFIVPQMSEDELLEKGLIKKIITSTNPKSE